MTRQEIYNWFWKRAKYYALREDAELYAEAAAAIFKQIPKQPIPSGSRECFVCPMCSRPLRKPITAHTLMSGRTVSRRGDSFCPSCGQAIDWGDSE